MSESLVPDPDPTPVAVVVPSPVDLNSRERRCEGCGCKIDVRGRIIERGDKLKSWFDVEDQLATVRKDLRVISDQRDKAMADLATARADLARYKSRGFGESL